MIEPELRQVSAELEDDWHRMRVTLHHAQGMVTRVDAEMERSPWTTCEGARARLRETFEGASLDNLAMRKQKNTNCTHLYDLALFAAAHAKEIAPTTYEARVSDPIDDVRNAVLWRNGEILFSWMLRAGRFSDPPEISGFAPPEISPWIASLPVDLQEGARLLRWAAMMGAGRQMDIPAGSSGARFDTAACFTFQPERAAHAMWKAGAEQDFSSSSGPLADRANMFPRV